LFRPISSLLDEAAAQLAAAGIESPRREARLLLAHALGLSQEALLRDRDMAVEAPGFTALVARRQAHEPLALIIGGQDFWTLTLAVSPATLVPRADSETLIEAALAAFPDRAVVRRILDLGTGTGCLLLAALSEFPDAWGVGVERSAAAASLAAANAASCGLAGRAGLVCGDWTDSAVGGFDLILCNPPYIESAAIPALMPEVARHEPRTALDGGPDGLTAYRRILPDLPRLLAPGGIAVLEMGAGQHRGVAALARAAGLDIAAMRADLGGVARALVLRCAMP